MSSAGQPATGNERTALAWQRTALALVGGSAILTRVTLERLGIASFISVVVAVPLGLWVFLESRRRYRRRNEVQSDHHSPSGRTAAALAVATLAVGLTELLALLNRGS